MPASEKPASLYEPSACGHHGASPFLVKNGPFAKKIGLMIEINAIFCKIRCVKFVKQAL